MKERGVVPLVRALYGLLRLGLKIFLSLVAAEAALVGALMGAAKLRRRLQEEPQEGFPREEQPEIELEQSGERLKLYLGYEDLYEAMLEEIGRAEHTIFIEAFIWPDDEVGRRFVEALARKAREGVRVYAVSDGLANISSSALSGNFPDGFYALRYRPINRPTSPLNPANFLRSHRKTLVVDGRVAFLGGFNISEAYLSRWRDTHVRVVGDVVREVENAFVDFWNRHRAEDLPEISLSRKKNTWNPSTMLRVNDPALGLFPIRDMFLRPLNRASKRIYLTTVYFVPSRAVKNGLTDAAERGVDVQVLLPKKSTYALADWIARRHFDELLRAGVRIFEYDEHYVIHSKTVTVDGAWSTVGSANIDSLSLFGLHEDNLEVYSGRFAGQMERVFEMDKTVSEEVTLEGWENRPLYHKLVEKALAPLRPFA